jgi:hypothetical protein
MALSVLGMVGLVIYTFPYLGLFCIPFGAFLVRQRVLRTSTILCRHRCASVPTSHCVDNRSAHDVL